jgi:hypothetical protein
MRGADLEPTHVLVEHLRRRLAAIARELGAAAAADEEAWWVAAGRRGRCADQS